MGKVRKLEPSTSLCKTGLVTLDKDFKPSGFWFPCLASERAMLIYKSVEQEDQIKVRKMCFEKQNALFRRKGALGCTPRESFFVSLCPQILHQYRSPTSRRIPAHLLKLPGPPEKRMGKPQQRQLWPACSTLWISPLTFFYLICSESLRNKVNTHINLLLQYFKLTILKSYFPVDLVSISSH